MNLGRAAIVCAALFAASPARAETKTIAAQGGLGLATGIGGALGGMVVGGVGGMLVQKKGDWTPAFVGATIVGGIGAIAGTVYGVTYAGDELDDSGSTLATAIGATGGLAVATGVEVILHKRDIKLPLPAHIAIVATAMVSGAVIGYQVTDDGGGPSMRIIAGVF